MKSICWLLMLLLSTNLVAQSKQVLLRSTKKCFFSNPVLPDVFRLWIEGETLTKGKVYFTITNSRGKQIYREMSDACDLLLDLNTDNEKVKVYYIRKAVSTFFNKSSFVKPAIAFNEEFDSDFSEKQIWSEIKATPNAIGFVYSYGYEGTYCIAYSKKYGKAVVYFSSD